MVDKNPNKRQSILTAATDAFLNEGYNSASMDRIAQEAGVSKQTVYSHFKDKQNLFYEVVDNLRARFLRGQVNVDALAKEPEDFLQNFALSFMGQFDDRAFTAMQRLLVEESSRHPELSLGFLERVAKPGINMMASYLKFHPKIKVADPDASARMFICSLVGFMYEMKFLHAEEHFPLERQRYAACLVKGILRE